ncbi:signal peptidase II [Synechococcus sp. CBW1006]|uniref:signal peptidase II n=1 Tax=Synechococcus sp. CBW1006 TaxID=1353138 RepID=UPI0018CDB2DB|nr:signal peptidase II [Synechococcus sp. CBW1006]QPN66152.1 signal peptidase II [Synechococcus sp. CBW1006]
MIRSTLWRRPNRRQLLCLGLAALLVILDQLSKHWALKQLAAGQVDTLIPGILQLRLVFNTGAAFSLFTGSTVALGLVSLLVALGLVLWLLAQPRMGVWQAAGCACLLGGAIGNGVDRWRLGAVVDFLEFVPVSFPVFNLADVAINVAVACFLLDLLGRPRSVA